jgi:Na+-transporting NADH:ubiquinone oxidoreductase subunit NqrC
MFTRFKTWLQATFPVLFKDTMPVWLTLVLTLLAAVVTAAGTYWLAPRISQNIELDKTRAARLSSSISDLNQSVVSLATNIRKFNASLGSKRESTNKVREEALDQITALQWKIVDLKVVLAGTDNASMLDKLGEQLTSLKLSIDIAQRPADQEKVLGSMQEVSKTMTEVLNRLYVAADLKD